MLRTAASSAGRAEGDMTYPSKCLEPQVMTLHCLDSMRPCESPVPIHHEGDMLGDRALAKCANEQLLEVRDGKLDRRRSKEPFPEARQMH